MMQRALIAGCGYVGTALARELGADGVEVLALRRSAQAALPGVHWLAADLGDAAQLERALAAHAGAREVDTVFFTAAASSHDEAGYRAIYVEAQRNLIAALGALGAAPRRYLFTSSTGVYGQTDGSLVDETSPTEPTAFSGRVMCEAEALLRELAWPSVALRLGGIYGPGRTRLIESVRRGSVTLPRETLYTNRIHRDDCAGALRHLAGVAHDGGVLAINGVDAEPAPQAEVLAFIAALCGVPAPEPSEAAPAARARGGNKRVSSARLLASGYTLRYPSYREGYRALVAAMNGSNDEA
ncbi:MAG: NAD-dependent epimerase/dehydratase family protein [Myxococcales bacterium]|nr:NAD-dependent epimerase/dehydratase family protein [Myxococcales bacterium]